MQVAIQSFYPQPLPSPSFFSKVSQFFKSDPLVEKVRAAAKKSLDWNEKEDLIIEGLKSPYFPKVQKELQSLIRLLKKEELKLLLEKVLKNDFEMQQKKLGNLCVKLMSVEQLRDLVSQNAKTYAKEFSEVQKMIESHDQEEMRLKLLKQSKQFFLVRLFTNFIRTIGVALGLLELGKEPNTYFETKYMLDIYWRFLEIPIQIVKFIIGIVINPLISLALIIGGAVVGVIASVFFKKWLNKVPDKLTTFSENLIEKIKNGSIKPLSGREEDVDKVINALAAHNDISRKHPLLVGEKGIGKSKMMEQLAWRLATGDVPPTLKGKSIFLIKSGDLLVDEGGFNFKTRLQQLKDAIGEHRKEIILIFEEAHQLLNIPGEVMNSALDTSSDSFYYAIGLTTPEDYKKITKTALKRRFKKIKIKEASKDQTRHILRKMVQKDDQYLKVSDTVLDHIYVEADKKMKDLHQPDKSTYVMSEAMQQIRSLREGATFQEKIADLKQEKEVHASELRTLPKDGPSLFSDKVRELKEKIKKKDEEIGTEQTNMQKHKERAQTFVQLNKQLAWHENWGIQTSELIANNPEIPPEILEKLYLFNAFFLLPQLKEYISTFAKDNDVDVEITEKEIDTIIAHLAKSGKTSTE